MEVLNLVISGIPSIPAKLDKKWNIGNFIVLNLVISGIPSILKRVNSKSKPVIGGFKPCYKWNTFNTLSFASPVKYFSNVLNLVISGIPSIL